MTAPKAEQLAKEARIQEFGGILSEIQPLKK